VGYIHTRFGWPTHVRLHACLVCDNNVRYKMHISFSSITTGDLLTLVLAPTLRHHMMLYLTILFYALFLEEN